MRKLKASRSEAVIILFQVILGFLDGDGFGNDAFLILATSVGEIDILEEHVLCGKENRTINGEIAGWGLSSDANHMTGPSRDENGLALAIRKSLQSAGISSDAALVLKK